MEIQPKCSQSFSDEQKGQKAGAKNWPGNCQPLTSCSYYFEIMGGGGGNARKQRKENNGVMKMLPLQKRESRTETNEQFNWISNKLGFLCVSAYIMCHVVFYYAQKSTLSVKQ